MDDGKASRYEVEIGAAREAASPTRAASRIRWLVSFACGAGAAAIFATVLQPGYRGGALTAIPAGAAALWLSWPWKEHPLAVIARDRKRAKTVAFTTLMGMGLGVWTALLFEFDAKHFVLVVLFTTWVGFSVGAGYGRPLGAGA